MDKEITYYLYHIPGKKIGVTRNLNSRVTEQQGYNPDEYEVLDQSTDIDYISSRELELQKTYGYKVDLKPYNKLFKMNINATEQTSTFPVPINKLKGRLMDEIGKTWETIHGTFEVNKDSIKWIMKNVKTSMFNKNRSYIYNKAFYESIIKPVLGNKAANEYREYMLNISERADIEQSKRRGKVAVKDNLVGFQKIRDWAQERGLYDKGDVKTQFAKLIEEVGELAQSILKKDEVEFADAIGDIVVVLTNMAYLEGIEIEHCIKTAYETISKRTGTMVNGTFVKDPEDKKKKDGDCGCND
jgi:NTP pyrophosphatase (non-canonical NTP hydrolase)